ncbi:MULTISPECIES: TonB-dependent hemoglobin/transferrin/lactoferrin family receptor [Rhizobium/Agrobacterium group]|uniref:TonB-dependent hemoglobin/transferrin/lactoferrin family receptor n=1 Tax=Rhizobium/Agrobacterium group TaxID=227290 RepID=UPI0022FFD690|nr:MULTISPECIES: TonB-dependent hemoglobin/transferrin/lactoferrin family receptor [Rhizobium/Agrobacterium group]MDA5634117.1 TonB-dependent hemoglobin/transferrin/lactoferrin family receptor [Agrobacterium sp. ST15.16.024]MDF1889632.1 TonB-dependent hemoglobin/transferrin/lactoferrin family receptor [Rhizobium rhizogenes]
MSISRTHSALLLCTAMSLLPLAGPARAQDAASQANGTTTLEKIVVKGKRVKSANAAADTPLASQTTAEEIRKKEINNVRDLGNTAEPGVDFIESKPGKPGGLFIRGLGGARVTTLIDNIPVPFFENYARSTVATTGMSDANNSYDFSSLSTVDVVRGADSSRIGAGALGGALVLRTLEPEDLIEDGRDWGGVAKTTYDSEDKSFGGSLAVAKKIENTSVLFQGGYKKGHERDSQGTADILGINRTEANPSDYDQYNLLFKVRQDLEGGHRIGLTAERFNLDSTTDLKTVQGLIPNPPAPASNFTPGNYSGYDDTRRERVSLDYSYEAPSTDGLIDSANLALYWQRLQKEAGSYGTRGIPPAALSAYSRDNDVEESSVGIVGDALSEFSVGNLNHAVRFGGYFQYSETQQFLRVVPASTVVSQSDMPDVDGKRLGLYLDDRISFADTGFALTPGVRLDWYDYSPKNSDAFRNNTGFSVFGLPDGQDGIRVSPKLLATYQLTPEIELFGQWSMAFRPPTVNELYIDFRNGNSYANIGNPNLKPETAQGFEIGANYASNDLNGKLTLFHNRYSNFIDVFRTTGNVVAGEPAMLFTWRNRDKVEISGVEVSARKDFANGIFLHGSLAYAYGKDSDTGEFIRTVAPLKSVLGIGYEQEQWGLDFSSILSAGMREDGPATTITGTSYQTFDAPGYGIFNLTGWWEPEQTKGLRIQAGIYNVFDKTYWNAVGVRDVSTSSTSTTNQPVDFYSEAGRTFKISLTQKF